MDLSSRFAGLELYFDDLPAARKVFLESHVAHLHRGGPQRWAAIRDPEGHTVLLLETRAVRGDQGAAREGT